MSANVLLANLTRDLAEKYSVDLRQFIDFRVSTLPNGMRISWQVNVR